MPAGHCVRLVRAASVSGSTVSRHRAASVFARPLAGASAADSISRNSAIRDSLARSGARGAVDARFLRSASQRSHAGLGHETAGAGASSPTSRSGAALSP
jgi:hypothetical protein